MGRLARESDLPQAPANSPVGEDDEFLRVARREELANGLSHGFGLLLGVVGSAVLLRSRLESADLWRALACGVYCLTLVGTFAASTLSHLCRRPNWKRAFRIVDQAAIYLMIAGSYTPFAVLQVEAEWRSLFAAVWLVALTAAICKVRSWRERLGVGFMVTYLLLGWVPGATVVAASNDIAADGIRWLAAGGLSYTVGTLFLAIDRRVPFAHLIWHLFVLAGAICHYAAIFWYS